MAQDGRTLRGGSRFSLEALERGVARVEKEARRASAAPLRALVALMAINAAAALVFALAGIAAGDPALFFREGMPGTWLSCAQLLLVALIAHSVHVLAAPGARWHRTFWGLAAVAFAVFAVDEILGTSQYVGTWLDQHAGLSPAEGFNDIGAVLLTLLFAGAALVLLPRAFVLLRRRLAALLLMAGAALGAGSQALDSFIAPTASEFVAEESLKLGAEAFLVAGMLAALRVELASARRRARADGAPAPHVPA